MTNLAMQTEWAVTEPEPEYPPVPRWWVERNMGKGRLFANPGDSEWAVTGRCVRRETKTIGPMTKVEAWAWWKANKDDPMFNLPQSEWHARGEYEEAKRYREATR